MAQKILYSINTYAPATEYTGPIPISRSTKIKTQRVDTITGVKSVIENVFCAVVPSNYRTKKLFSGHLMVDLSVFKEGDGTAWAQAILDAGFNHVWLHMENLNNDYIKKLLSMMDACAAVGLKVSPGNFGLNFGQSTLYNLTWNHPAMYTVEGKRVYNGYYVVQDGAFNYSTQQLIQAGYPQNEYLLITSVIGYPRQTQYGEYNLLAGSDYGVTIDGIFYPDTGNLNSTSPGNPTSLDVVYAEYDTASPLDGIITFLTGDGIAPAQQVEFDTNLIQASKKYGKFAWTGLSAYYASFDYSYYCFEGMALLLNNIIGMAPEDRPDAISCTTMNDYVENSYLAPLCVAPVESVSYIPQRFTGQVPPGGALRYPLVAHDGFRQFCEPWISAYLNNNLHVTFSADRLFVAHMLHDRGVTSMSKNLDDMAYPLQNDVSTLQNWWPTCVYTNCERGVTGFIPQLNTPISAPDILYNFRVGAHLTSPAQIKINDTLSAVFPTGPVYFDVPMDSFKGWPRFAIVRNGIEIKAGFGPQEVTDNAWPGCYGLLAYEVNPLNLAIPEMPTIIADDAAKTIHATSPLGSTEIEYSVGDGFFAQYDGAVIQVGDISVPARFWRFRIKANNTRIASEAASSPAFTGGSTPNNAQLYALFGDPYYLNGRPDTDPIEPLSPLIYDASTQIIVTNTNTYSLAAGQTSAVGSQELFKITDTTVAYLTMVVQLDAFGNTAVIGASANNPGSAANVNMRVYHNQIWCGNVFGVNSRITALNGYILRMSFHGNINKPVTFSYSTDNGVSYTQIIGLNSGNVSLGTTFYPNLYFSLMYNSSTDDTSGLVAADLRQFGLTSQ